MFKNKKNFSYLVNFRSKKGLNFLILVFFSGNTNHKKSLKVKPWGSKFCQKP